MDTLPNDARVRVMNIKPVFYQGMELSPGIYHVEVSANGYETHKIRVGLAEAEDKRLDISLKKRAAPKAGEKITNSLGMTFVYVTQGTFMMGSPSSEPGRDDDENRHRVTLSRGFYLQATADPTGPVSGSRRVSRGGSWDYYAKSCRSANRNHFAPSSKRYLQGFRLLREP